MRLGSFAFWTACFLLFAACGGRTTSDGGGTGGGTSTGDDGGADDGGADDGGADDGGADDGGADDGGVTSTWTGGSTGGSTGSSGDCGTAGPCRETEYCDWDMDSCGTADYDTSSCEPRPEACDNEYLPVCACNGEIYSNACWAAARGVDVSAAGGCEPPESMFCCGFRFCELNLQYCAHSVSDVDGFPDGFECRPVPVSCDDVPTCGCLANEPCFEFGCEEVVPGGLKIVCPGG
jgi:hypothetical protein